MPSGEQTLRRGCYVGLAFPLRKVLGRSQVRTPVQADPSPETPLWASLVGSLELEALRAKHLGLSAFQGLACGVPT